MKYLLLFLPVLFLCSCAHQGPFVAPDISPVALPLADAHVATQHAQVVAKHLAATAAPAQLKEFADLQLTLATAESKETQAENAISSLQTQIGTLTVQANEMSKEKDDAKAETAKVKAEVQPKLNRNHIAIALSGVFVMVCTLIGPWVRGAYPVLLFIPTTLAALAAGLGAIFLVVGTTGLLELFGFL